MNNDTLATYEDSIIRIYYHKPESTFDYWLKPKPILLDIVTLGDSLIYVEARHYGQSKSASVHINAYAPIKPTPKKSIRPHFYVGVGSSGNALGVGGSIGLGSWMVSAFTHTDGKSSLYLQKKLF